MSVRPLAYTGLIAAGATMLLAPRVHRGAIDGWVLRTRGASAHFRRSLGWYAGAPAEKRGAVLWTPHVRLAVGSCA